MKMSCLPVSFFKAIQEGEMSIKDWVNVAKNCGLDGIDLSVLLVANHTPVYLSKLKRDIAEMPLIMMTTYSDFIHPNPQQREREKEYLYRDIALASELGARYLRMTPGQAHPETDIKLGINIAVEAFKRADEVASRYGIQLLFENHSKPGCWQYSDFSHPTEIFLEIANGICDTGIGINFDTANTLVYGSDVMAVLEEVIDQVVTVHASDTSTYGSLNPTVIGTGIVPFESILRRMKQNKFYGMDMYRRSK